MFRRKIVLLACFFLCSSPLFAAKGETIRTVVLINGRAGGSELDEVSADGHMNSTYEFNDRGRGPKVTARYVIATTGLPQRVDITGNDYLKAAVDEHFAFENGLAHWQSTSEKGNSKETGFYISNNGPPGELGLLVSALLRANGSLKLFPGGEARLERMADLNLENSGRKVHVIEYGITGLSFEPQVVWLDDQQHFFASPGPWFSFIREGWESSNEELYAHDRSAEDSRLTKIAQQLAHHPQKPVLFEHVRLFDSERATTENDQSVLVEGDRIVAVGPSSVIAAPSDAEKIDGAGKTLVPGLFDMHVHAQAIDGLLNIASGVTSVRDMGNDIDELQHLQKRWDDGTAIGPRVWKSGFIDGHSPYQAPTGLYADNAEQALAAVDRYADLGYVQIKLYSSLNPDLVPAIVKEAHSRGLRVSGHVPQGIVAAQFVQDGADEIQHINFIFLNFLASQVKDTRTPERFTAVGENAAKLDLHSSEVNSFIELLKEHHTVVDVTLAAFEQAFTGRPGQASSDFTPVLDRLPVQFQRAAYIGGHPVNSQNDQLYKDSYEAMLRMTKRMYDAGIPILAGTDATAGLWLHRELELEVRAGIPAAQALKIATFNAAQLLKANDLGSIAPGKKADLVLVDGNPAQNISDIRRCRLVMKNGVMYQSADMYGAVGIAAAQ